MTDEMTDDPMAPETQLDRVELMLSDIARDLALVKDYMIKTDRVIGQVAENVMPTIEQLKKSPMLKMLGVK